MLLGITGLTTRDSQVTGIMFIVLALLVGIIDFGMFVYNLYLGIKILIAD